MFGPAVLALAAFGAWLGSRPSRERPSSASIAGLSAAPAPPEAPPRRRTSAGAPSKGSAAAAPAQRGVPPASADAAARSPAVAARRETRERADAIRKRLEERGRALPSAPSSRRSPEAEREAAQRRREFLQKAVREQYIPVAKSCYDELLSRLPQAAGKVVLYFSIVGDQETGGVVDHVETQDGTTFDDPEFLLCMRESLYSTLFDPPPYGETTVEYPLELSP